MLSREARRTLCAGSFSRTGRGKSRELKGGHSGWKAESEDRLNRR